MIALMFAGSALIWGSSFLFMKVALEGASFGQIAWSRAILGALVLAVFVAIGRHALPREPIVWLHFLVVGVTNCTIPHLLFAWAEQHVSSSLASIYNSFTPIATAIMVALVYRVERLGGQQVAGVVVGILGAVVVIAPWSVGALSGDLWGQLACLGAACSYGVAIGYTRTFISHRSLSGTSVAFMNIGMAALVMLVLTPIVAVGPVELSLPVVGSLLLLGGLGTGVAYIWNIGVLRAWGATASSTVTYLMPVVGIGLGVSLLGETLTWNEPLGAVLVLAGILLVQGKLRRRPKVSDTLSSAAG
ncbi:DMT family transporter [Salinibacterium sp. SYSU T00001]|uniref:DMT family transporter n=1 Tax=Homoserinimonas sedimenticola TaxID=2986805 RepID=UPI00223586D2|nr:DMT family transporter [Salinibacterium sedimenticola]MCW4385538.1 DMT family transporter [Salinibacterium sedimenticola]